MLLVKSSIFGTILNTRNMQETNLYLKNSYMCRLDQSFASKWKLVNFVIIEFAIKPSRNPMLDPPHDPNRGCDL